MAVQRSRDRHGAAAYRSAQTEPPCVSMRIDLKIFANSLLAAVAEPHRSSDTAVCTAESHFRVCFRIYDPREKMSFGQPSRPLH
jgi:hypothetical protein